LTTPGWHLGGVEILSLDSQALARSRVPIRIPVTNHALVSLSDVLLFDARSGEELPANLPQAMGRMISSNRVDGDRKVGLYWEMYDLNLTGADTPVSLTLTRQKSTGLQAIRENLGLSARNTPISIKWMEPRTTTPLSPRSVLLDLSLVPKGKYDLRIALGDGDHPLAISQRTVEIR
jgi:hypothetical protein